MKEYLETRQDYNLINVIDFGNIFDIANIKEQIKGIRFKADNLKLSFDRSVSFLESNLSDVLSANKALEIIESRFDNVRTSLNFILKSRLEIAENTKDISLVDLDRGLFKNLIYSIDMSGITFDKDIGDSFTSSGPSGVLNNTLLLVEGGDKDFGEGFQAVLLVEE